MLFLQLSYISNHFWIIWERLGLYQIFLKIAPIFQGVDCSRGIFFKEMLYGMPWKFDSLYWVLLNHSKSSFFDLLSVQCNSIIGQPLSLLHGIRPFKQTNRQNFMKTHHCELPLKPCCCFQVCLSWFGNDWSNWKAKKN